MVHERLNPEHSVVPWLIPLWLASNYYGEIFSTKLHGPSKWIFTISRSASRMWLENFWLVDKPLWRSLLYNCRYTLWCDVALPNDELYNTGR